MTLHKVMSFELIMLQVVPEASACLPGPFRTIPLPTDHLKMAKFDGPHNSSYKMVMPAIRNMAKVAAEKGKLRWVPREFKQDNSDIAAVNLECQKALFISWPKTDLETIKRRLGDRTENTCEWLLGRTEYTTWLQGKR